MSWHIYVICQEGMLNIRFIIQISMSVVSDFAVVIIIILTVFSAILISSNIANTVV